MPALVISFLLAIFVSQTAVAQTDKRPELALERSAEYDYSPPEPGTYRLPAIQPAGDGAVLTADGKPTHLRDVLTGHITLLSFIYTRCADPRACPVATGALYQVHDISTKDRSLAENLRLVTFSFDPEHDTPRVMAEYGERLRPGDRGSEWWFLTTRSSKELQPILRSYGQAVDRKKDPNDVFGPFYHTLRVYLIDEKAQIRNIYAFGMLDPRLVVSDIRTLMMETAAGD